MGTLFNRRRYMGGAKGLPYDAEIWYLESLGSQWIDTGIAPSKDLSFNCVFLNSSNGSPGYGNVFGARYASQNNEYSLSQYQNGLVSVGTRNTSLGIYKNVINNVSYEGSNTVTVNGVNKSINTSDFTRDVGTIVLYAIRNGGSVTQMQAGRIYSCSFGNVRDFIPVRVGAKGYMYDKVSGNLFGNSGTGDFALGPDVPTVDTMTRVEYLENSGTQYFDINLIPDATTGMRITIESTNTTDTYIAGLRNDSGNTRWCVGHKSTIYYYGYGTYENSDSGMPNAAILDLNYMGDGKFVVRDISDNSELHSAILPTLSFTPSLPIWIIKPAGASSMGDWRGKLYSVQITQNNAVIMNLIPVRLGQEGYLYDTINDKFYFNLGTGDFILGPDKT